MTTFSILYSYPTSDRYYRGQRGLRVEADTQAEAIAKIRQGYGGYPACPDAQIVRAKIVDKPATQVDAPAPPKRKKGFQYAGPCPDGSFISRKTANPYTHAVAIVDQSEKVWKGGNVCEYVANPNFGLYVGVTWSSRYELAVKRADYLRSVGHRNVVVVPVVEEVVAS